MIRSKCSTSFLHFGGLTSFVDSSFTAQKVAYHEHCICTERVSRFSSNFDKKVRGYLLFLFEEHSISALKEYVHTCLAEFCAEQLTEPFEVLRSTTTTVCSLTNVCLKFSHANLGHVVRLILMRVSLFHLNQVRTELCCHDRQ